tara:strand:+ start:12001 stop:12837 length:837 start_codon:yes stop_codon:yes gene_type:complete
MSKIMVTGGAGFVGSHLVHKLVEMGHDVTVIDNYSNYSENPENENARYFEMDTDELEYQFENETFDYIFHLGEYSRVESSFHDFDKVMAYNYHSFPSVLEFAKRSGAKLIYSGSSTKFADNTPAASPYAYTKAQNTELLKNYAEWYGLDYTIVYFYNVYGDYENDATVVKKFLNLAKKGMKTLPVTSPGTQYRNFTHIDDIIEGLVRAGFKGSGDGYGIGSDEKWTVLDLVNMLGCEPEMMPEKKGNRMDAQLVTHQVKALGWRAQKSLPKYILSQLG